LLRYADVALTLWMNIQEAARSVDRAGLEALAAEHRRRELLGEVQALVLGCYAARLRLATALPKA
jgi:hypothetical protein